MMTSWPFCSGDMADRIRSFDWAMTGLGPIESWEERLKGAVDMMLAFDDPAHMCVGGQWLQLYNDSFAALIGPLHPAALGQDVRKIFAEADFADSLQRAFNGETFTQTGQSYPFIRKTELGPAWFDLSAAPVRDGFGRVIAVLTQHKDVTARILAEKNLKENEARFRLLVDGIAKAVWETDEAGLVQVDSPSWRSYTGQSSQERLGHGWLDAVHPEDRASAQRRWRGAVEAGQNFDAEFRIWHVSSNRYRWTNIRAVPVVKADGSIEKWFAMIIDIDERGEAEALLRERESDLARVQRIGQVGGLDIDVSGGMRSMRSPEYLRLHGLPPETRMESHEQWLNRVHPDDREQAERTLFAAFEGQNISYQSEYRIIRPSDGAVRWIHALADIERDPQGRAIRLVGAHLDVTDQKRMQEVLRESEDRQAFLLKLSDALRPLVDPRQMRKATCLLLGEALRASRVYHVDCEAERGVGIVEDDYALAPLPTLAGRYPLEAFRSTYERVAKGRTWIVRDVALEADIDHQERRSYANQGVVSWIYVPLLKSQTLHSVLCVGHHEPRGWTDNEVRLAEETADRLWAAIQRARAELALRRSEERFQQFAKASSDALWIRNAETLEMEYASEAYAAIYGAPARNGGAEFQAWAAMIVPDDRDDAVSGILKARDGMSVVNEYRIMRPSDGTFRWVRNTAFPLYDVNGNIERIGGLGSDVTEARELSNHKTILLAELQHRVRNIMAMIRSVANRTADSAGDVEGYRSLIAGRLLALARVQTLLTRSANQNVSIGTIVRDEIGAQAAHEGQYELTGPDVRLAPKAAEILTLALHELSTNALKYGALSVAQGRVNVAWRVFKQHERPWLGFDWSEEGGPAPPPADPARPRRRGFGSELIEAKIPYELGGLGTSWLEATGLRCHIEFPLKDGDSILETDAPMRATVFGGGLDMTGAADLSGQTILVVEDDFYLASDAVRALRGAGAESLGPCPNEDAALDLLKDADPTAALLDINLGHGASFAVAKAMQKRGIPFIFMTGYDEEIIPPEFDGVPRLQKPVELRQVVNTFGAILARR